MATFNNGESGSSVRAKINAVLQHADGTAGEIVFNDAGADVDFRIESDTNANAFFLDGATGNVGVGTGSPVYRLDVQSADGNAMARFRDTDSVHPGFIINHDVNAAWAGNNAVLTGEGIYYQNSINVMRIYTNSLERMRLDSSGNLGIGTITPNNRLHAVSTPPASVPSAGTAGHPLAVGTTPYGVAVGTLNDGRGYIQATRWDGTATNYDLLIQPNGGNLGLGVTPSAWDVGQRAFDFGITGTLKSNTTAGSVVSLGNNCYYGSGSWRYKQSSQAVALYDLRDTGEHRWYTAPSGTAGNAITFTQAMTLDASGRLGIGESSPDYRLDVNGAIGFTPGSSVTPVDNGDVVFELTNNTTLTVKARGSDGVVRSATITLA